MLCGVGLDSLCRSKYEQTWLVHFGSIVVFETLISSSMFYVVLAMTAAINTHCVFFPMVSSFSGAGKLGQRGLPFFETIGQLDARFDCTFDVYADMVGQWPTQCVLVWGLLFPARFFDRGATKPFKEIQTRYNVFIFGAVLGVLSFFFFSSFLFSISLFFSLSLFITAIDSLDYSFTILETADVAEIDPDMGSTIDGVLCTGMYFDGARWDYDNKYVCDPRPAENFTLLPVTHFLPVPGHKPNVNDYACPCYKTSTRSGALSTTGMSTNYVLNVELPCGASKRPSQWVLAGVALLTNLDD